MATSIRRTSVDLQVAIADWLIYSNARIRSGRHAGAIAGWLDECGTAQFAYPEITGYYLSWLAQVAACRPDLDVRPAAIAAIAWLNKITCDDCLPATRYYPDERNDWRNDAVFTFDLAMICSGLHAVRGLVPKEPRRTVLRRLLRRVLGGEDALPAAIQWHRELPDRWSTRPGPFQLKTAAALLSIEEHPVLWKTLYRWLGRVLDEISPNELHAAFYALEGLIQFGVSGAPGALQEATTCFETLFREIDDTRSDVVAQGLWLGCCLQSLGFLQSPSWNDRLIELRSRLEAFILDSGNVSFLSPGNKPIHSNTWAAIFAWQALIMSDFIPAGETPALPEPPAGSGRADRNRPAESYPYPAAQSACHIADSASGNQAKTCRPCD